MPPVKKQNKYLLGTCHHTGNFHAAHSTNPPKLRWKKHIITSIAVDKGLEGGLEKESYLYKVTQTVRGPAWM
jgi:hypothetical protein